MTFYFTLLSCYLCCTLTIDFECARALSVYARDFKMAKRVRDSIRESIGQNTAKRHLSEAPRRPNTSVPNVVHFKLAGSSKRKSRAPKRVDSPRRQRPPHQKPHPPPHQKPHPSALSGR